MRSFITVLFTVVALGALAAGCADELGAGLASDGYEAGTDDAGGQPFGAAADTRTVGQALGPQTFGFEALDRTSTSGVPLRWDNFSTSSRCVDLYRRAPSATSDVRIASNLCAAGPNSFTDSSAEAGVLYTYKLTYAGSTTVRASDQGVRATTNAASLSGSITYSSCTSAITTANDRDGDGMQDSCEYTFANAFRPDFVFAGGKNRTRDAWTPYWAVRPAGGTSTVSIFYAPAYSVDEGDTGAYDHYGDTEFVVIEIEGVSSSGSPSSSGTYWRVKRAYLSAHWAASTDGSRWVSWSDLNYVDRSRGRAQIFVAYSKHGNFASLRACDRGGFVLSGSDGSDYCAPGSGTSFTVDSGRNIHLVAQPVVVGTRSENFTDVSWLFCGWNSSAKADRSDCVPKANSYGVEIARWRGVGGSLSDGAISRAP